MNSIVYIGDIAIPSLLKVYNNPVEDERKRSYALYTLIRLNYKGSKELIRNTLYHIDDKPQVLAGAARSAGLIDYKEMTTKLIQISKAFHNNPDPDYIYLVKNIAFALRYLGGVQAKEEIKDLLESPYSMVREEAIRSITVLGDKTDISKLSEISLNDSLQNIRQLAGFAIKAIEINSEQNALKPQ
jgi:HEAT repeat protein